MKNDWGSKEIEIEIPGYRIYGNDGTKNIKGKEIAVKNSIIIISVEVSRYEEGQNLWILLNNQKQKIRTVVIYQPQENMTPNSESILLYKTITEKTEKVKQKHQQVLMVGHFNVKIKNHQVAKKQYLKKEDISKK